MTIYREEVIETMSTKTWPSTVAQINTTFPGWTWCTSINGNMYLASNTSNTEEVHRHNIPTFAPPQPVHTTPAMTQPVPPGNKPTLNRFDATAYMLQHQWPDVGDDNVIAPPHGWKWHENDSVMWLYCGGFPNIHKDDVERLREVKPPQPVHTTTPVTQLTPPQPAPPVYSREQVIEIMHNRGSRQWPIHLSGDLRAIPNVPHGWEWRKDVAGDTYLLSKISNRVILERDVFPPTQPATPTKDPVNSPAHYEVFEDLEAIEVIACALTREQWYGYCLGNTLKYRLRAGKKENTPVGVDLGKADKHTPMFEQFKELNRDG